MTKHILSLLTVACTASCLLAQDTNAQEQGLFTAQGKIYVVMGVLAIILLGILLFLFSMERRLRRLERDEPSA